MYHSPTEIAVVLEIFECIINTVYHKLYDIYTIISSLFLLEREHFSVPPSVSPVAVYGCDRVSHEWAHVIKHITFKRIRATTHEAKIDYTSYPTKSIPIISKNRP